MRIVEVLVAWRRPLVAFVLATLLAATAYLVFADKQYDADAKLQVVPIAANDRVFAGFSLLREGADDDTPAQTAAELVEASQVVDAVADRLVAPRDDLLRAVSAKAEGRSNVVTVRARWSDARRAAQIANAFAGEFVARRSSRFQAELMRTIARLRENLRDVPAAQRAEPPARDVVARLATLRSYEGLPDPTVEVVSDAVAPQTYSWPRPVVVLAGALGGALLVSLGAASAFALLAPRFWDREIAVVRVDEPVELPATSPVFPPVAAKEPPEAKPPPAAEPQAPPVAEPEPVAPAAAGVWSLPQLERLVDERAADFPDRIDEWRAYLFFLRDHATPEERLPPSFDALVDEVFEDLF